MLYKGFIDWRIPTGMLSTVFIITFIAGRDPIAHLLAGGLILGAFLWQPIWLLHRLRKEAAGFWHRYRSYSCYYSPLGWLPGRGNVRYSLNEYRCAFN